jgi:hypothetical protein
MVFIVLLGMFMQSPTHAASEKLVVTPPIVMPQELVKIQEKVLPPPTPVVFK